jgi:hypothetical protein
MFLQLKHGFFQELSSVILLLGFCVQVALDQAAFLLDLAAIDGSWDESREQLAAFYREAGFDELAAFIAAIDTQ